VCAGSSSLYGAVSWAAGPVPVYRVTYPAQNTPEPLPAQHARSSGQLQSLVRMWGGAARQTARQVWLGTRPVAGRAGCLARHWAVRVGEDFWCEVDGLSGAEEPETDYKNTINGGSAGWWWGWGRGPAGEHRGPRARSG
jgi:hypothetical protein